MENPYQAPANQEWPSNRDQRKGSPREPFAPRDLASRGVTLIVLGIVMVFTLGLVLEYTISRVGLYGGSLFFVSGFGCLVAAAIWKYAKSRVHSTPAGPRSGASR